MPNSEKMKSAMSKVVSVFYSRTYCGLCHSYITDLERSPRNVQQLVRDKKKHIRAIHPEVLK